MSENNKLPNPDLLLREMCRRLCEVRFSVDEPKDAAQEIQWLKAGIDATLELVEKSGSFSLKENLHELKRTAGRKC